MGFEINMISKSQQICDSWMLTFLTSKTCQSLNLPETTALMHSLFRIRDIVNQFSTTTIIIIKIRKDLKNATLVFAERLCVNEWCPRNEVKAPGEPRHHNWIEGFACGWFYLCGPGKFNFCGNFMQSLTLTVIITYTNCN